MTLGDEQGQQERLRPTGSHKFYSLDRNEFIPAEDLREGEHLQGVKGRLTLLRREKLPGAHRVYNMTVETEHVYHVALMGALVHNTCPGNAAYEAAVAAAKARYPNLAGKINQHHITPKYLGGPVNGPTAPLDGAYHQVITNEFRNLHPYGTPKPSPEGLLRIMRDVYRKFLLPSNP